MRWPLRRRPYIHSKLAQVDASAQEKQNIMGVRLWTEEEWLASRAKLEGNSDRSTSEIKDRLLPFATDKQAER